MTAGLSGQQLAASNLQKFQNWVAEREAAGDWPDYIRQCKLNRSEIADECGFALSVVRQNPAVKSALEALEYRLQACGVLETKKEVSKAVSEATSHSTDKRLMAAKGKAEARVKALEEQNASLKAEVASLRERLRRFEHLDDHLGRTGRLLPA